MAADNFVSFKLGAFTGGAGLTERDYLLTDHTIAIWDYEGKGAQTIALRIAAQPGKAQGKNFVASGEPQVQYYSIGDPTSFSPDATGHRIVAVGTRSTLGKSSNFYIYLENLVNAGFPEDRYDNDVSAFNNMVVHITPIPAPKREGLPSSNVMQTSAAPKEQREKTI